MSIKDVPIPARIDGKVPCNRCKSMAVPENLVDFLKSYENGYITDEEATEVILEASKESRLHPECAKVLAAKILEKYKPKKKKK